MKHFSLLILLLGLLATGCKPEQTDPCKPSVSTSASPAGSQVENDGEDKPATCPDDGTTPEPVPDDTETDPDPIPDETEPDGPLPSETAVFGSSVNFVNFTASDEEKVQKALELIQAVIRSEEFRQRVYDHEYKGAKTFADNRGWTNQKIYQTFLEGAEKLKPEKNSIMDLELELYTNNSTNTVGYTYPTTLRIWMNRKYFNSYKPPQVARNLFHEWTHKLGFEHDSASTAARPYSVPYGVGKIIEELALKVQGEELALTMH